MTTIQPKGEKTRQAVRWISEMRQDGDDRAIHLLIEEASQRFNLSPKDEEFLKAFYKEGATE
jgi:hypothetical protein